LKARKDLIFNPWERLAQKISLLFRLADRPESFSNSLRVSLIKRIDSVSTAEKNQQIICKAEMCNLKFITARMKLESVRILNINLEQPSEGFHGHNKLVWRDGIFPNTLPEKRPLFTKKKI
jgi:hypothetical protein